MTEDRVLEPDGGNFYRPHLMQVHSGRFWRCKHGVTGLDGDWNYVGCKECAQEDPESYKRFHAKAAT